MKTNTLSIGPVNYLARENDSDPGQTNGEVMAATVAKVGQWSDHPASFVISAVSA